MSMRQRLIGVLLSALASAAVAEPRVFPVATVASQNDVYPDRVSGFPNGVKGLADVTYSVLPGFRPLVVDLYLPATSSSRPLVLFVHGGGWVGGNTRHSGALANFPEVLAALAAEGFVVASVEYRLAAEAPFPAALQDVRAALRFLKENAAKYHIDGDKVAVWGGSAGGQLAALAAVSCGDQTLDPTPAPARSECVQGAVIWYGVFDFGPLAARGGATPDQRFLGCGGACDATAVRRASPLAYVDATDPPFLLVHGVEDRTVDVGQSRAMETALRAAGVDVASMYLPNVDHSFIGRTAEETRDATLAASNATFDFFHRLFGSAPR